ncbi:MAG: hypothetical protein OEY34_04510, partial [Cyclobacteriaceae bacterium]|nr:hypothetical protein [Cyclobacteriaceae bacterium]
LVDYNLMGVKNIQTDFSALRSENTIEKAFIDALNALKQNDRNTAENLFNTYHSTNPYFEDMGILAARFYVENKQLDKAYNTLQKNMFLNRNSIRLSKEYVKVCGRIGYMNFGLEVLARLKSIISPEEYNELSDELNKLYAEWEESLEY